MDRTFIRQQRRCEVIRARGPSEGRSSRSVDDGHCVPLVAYGEEDRAAPWGTRPALTGNSEAPTSAADVWTCVAVLTPEQ